MSSTRFAACSFYCLDDAPFDPKEYSALKFGSDSIARKFGYELAEKFFDAHAETLLANRCVVIPSPYNHVENAATIMTKHFVDRLNDLLVYANGEHVEYSIIHRKVTYTSDYGFLPKERRQQLIANDRFYMNRQFLQGKTLIFIDDVLITGTHEEKLKEILEEQCMDNDVFFLYFAQLYGPAAASIEGELNFAAINSPRDYLKLVKEPYHHVIVRTIKYLLGLTEREFLDLISEFTPVFTQKLYHGALGEGYYRVPKYQGNFKILRECALSPRLV